MSLRQTRFHLLACSSLIALILLCVFWELWLAPLRPGSFVLAFKALPLLLPLRGVLKQDNYTMQWTSMLIWLYFTEGVVRAYSDKGALSNYLAMAEILLSLLYFIAILGYLRPLKQAARARKVHHE